MSEIKASKGARPVITVFLVVGVLLLAGAIALGIFFAVENSSRVQVDTPPLRALFPVTTATETGCTTSMWILPITGRPTNT